MELNNLPTNLDSFVGRDNDLNLLEKVLESSRLGTVLGPGGIGKTRLCQQFALGYFYNRNPAGGVWFCDLSEVRDASQINEVMVPILGLAPNEGLDSGAWIKTCAEAMASRGPCLFILDNAEQIVADLAPVLSQWIETAPEVRFLVTSRERLGVQGEVTHLLQSLDDKEGVRLFIDRARSLQPDFEPTEEDIHCIETIVEDLEGMPLAIELASSQVRMLSLPRLLEGLSERLVLLRSHRRDVPARQRTMWGTIAWSWDLLSPWEQECLVQLTSFHGGFTLEAAEQIVDLSEHPEAPWVPFVVESLMEKSLIRSVRPTDLPSMVRFDMFVTIRDFALEHLPHSAKASQARHAQYWARLADPTHAYELGIPGTVERARTLQIELDNLQAATAWALDAEETETAVGACIAVSEPLLSCAPARLTHWLQQSLALDNLPSSDRVSLLKILGHTLERRGSRVRAIEVLNEALVLARTAQVDTSRILAGLARQQIQLGQHERAQTLIEEAVDLMIDDGALHEALCLLGNVVTLQHLLGRFDDATPHVQRLLALQGKKSSPAQDLTEVCKLTLAFLRTTGNQKFEGTFLNDLGVLQAVQGDSEQAKASMKASIRIAQTVGNRLGEIIGLGNLGDLYLQENRKEDAQNHLGEALRMSREIGYSLAEGAYLASLAELALRNGNLERSRLDFTVSEALLRDVGDPIELCKLLARRGHLDLAQGNLDDANQTLQEAMSIAEGIGAGPESELCHLTRSLQKALEA